jgi:uncharacterized protein YjbI with pentapeptide repeats
MAWLDNSGDCEMEKPSSNGRHTRENGRRTTDADLAGTVYDNVNLSGARFHEVNFEGAEFVNVALTGSIIRNACLAGVSIADAGYEGMRIEGILVTELLRVYRETVGTKTYGPCRH